MRYSEKVDASNEYSLASKISESLDSTVINDLKLLICYKCQKTFGKSRLRIEVTQYVYELHTKESSRVQKAYVNLYLSVIDLLCVII
jgi:hypothetical protein